MNANRERVQRVQNGWVWLPIVVGLELGSIALFIYSIASGTQQYGHPHWLWFVVGILGMITAEYLFYNNKQVLEGELTKMRSWLVNKNSLAICARNLHLDEFLFLSYSARQSLARGNDGMLPMHSKP